VFPWSTPRCVRKIPPSALATPAGVLLPTLAAVANFLRLLAPYGRDESFGFEGSGRRIACSAAARQPSRTVEANARRARIWGSLRLPSPSDSPENRENPHLFLQLEGNLIQLALDLAAYARDGPNEDVKDVTGDSEIGFVDGGEETSGSEVLGEADEVVDDGVPVRGVSVSGWH
jgi:hypothetical protein